MFWNDFFAFFYDFLGCVTEKTATWTPLGIGARRVKTTRQLAQIRPTTRPFFLGELFFFGIFYGYKNTGTQVHRYTGTQVHRYTGTQVHRYTGTQVHRCTTSHFILCISA